MGWKFDALLPPLPVPKEVNGFILPEPYVLFSSEHVCRANIVNNLCVSLFILNRNGSKWELDCDLFIGFRVTQYMPSI